ncbi:PUMP2 [Symbiodinium necroappetens]|uniref:PUMP2 protein n=1 Tax=Symbiodinium necroappetens TaxID=1628268 RepID=A0A812JHD9_9DINO|nr:PUMP2 [Symbiodinium necroappetens]
MDLLVQLDAAVLSRILSSLPQRQALALTILAQDWLQLVAAHLWRLVVSPDLSPGLAQTAATHCVRLREVVFQSSSQAAQASEQEARAFWLRAAGIWRSLLTTPVAPLRQLTLRGSGEADGKSAVPFLAELPKSADLCLRDFHVENMMDVENQGIMAFLLEFLPPLPLTSLRLRNCNLKSSEILDLCRALQMAPMLNSLSDLDLSQNAMFEEGAGALAQLLPVSGLRSLALSGNGLGPVGLAALANAFPPSLKHLDLSLNGLGTVGLAVLQQSNLRLESLNVRGNWLGASDTEVLPRLLRSMSDSISRNSTYWSALANVCHTTTSGSLLSSAMASPAKEIGAAMVAATAVPLALNWTDVIKTRMQGIPSPGCTVPAYTGGFLTVAQRVLAEEGLLALWSTGMLASLGRECTVVGTRIGAYPAVRDGLSMVAKGKSGGEAGLGSKFSAGVVLGALSGLLASPFDLVRIRVQAEAGRCDSGILTTGLCAGQPQRIRGTVSGFKAVLSNGVLNIFRGSGINVVRSVCMTVGTVPVYEHSKHLAKSQGVADSPALHLGAGVVAGLAGTTVTAPADVVRTRIMQEGGASRTHVISAVSAIARDRGLAGFFRGWIPAYMRVGPLFLLMPALVEQVRKLFGLDFIV